MTKGKLCIDCGDKKPGKFYSDPRDPPLDEGECMCKDCTISALYEVIDDMETRLSEYKDELWKLEPQTKPKKEKKHGKA